MSPQTFLLPDLGEGLVEAELVTWLVAVGDTVHVDQPIAEVETAKSVVEVPCPFEGVVVTLHGAEGELLEVGKPLISVSSSFEVGASSISAPGSAKSPAPTPARPQALPLLASSRQVPRASGPTAVPTTPGVGAEDFAQASPAAGLSLSSAESSDAAAPSDSGSPADTAATSPASAFGAESSEVASVAAYSLSDSGSGDSGTGAESRPAPSSSVSPSDPGPSDANGGVDAGSASGSGNVLIGYGTSGHGGAGRTRVSRAQRILADVARASISSAPDISVPVQADGPRRVALVVSPLVRKMARDGGLVLADVVGSGADGLILRSDVQAALNGVHAGTSATSAQPSSKSTGAGAAGLAGGVSAGVDPRTGLEIVSNKPLTGIKKAAAAAFTRSRREIPEATVWVDVDATALVELRASLKATGAGAPSLLAFIARFVTAGLERFPALNTQISSKDGVDSVLEFGGINLGFAAQTDRGLVVPVLRNAQGRSARQLDAAIRELAETARGGKASPQLLSGGTFTVNNYGVFGVDGSAAIINHPEAAMLGIGRIMDKPWVVDGQLCVRKMTELTLAFDHRVCDGAVASGFLRFVADGIENPGTVLAEL